MGMYDIQHICFYADFSNGLIYSGHLIAQTSAITWQVRADKYYDGNDIGIANFTIQLMNTEIFPTYELARDYLNKTIKETRKYAEMRCETIDDMIDFVKENWNDSGKMGEIRFEAFKNAMLKLKKNCCLSTTNGDDGT